MPTFPLPGCLGCFEQLQEKYEDHGLVMVWSWFGRGLVMVWSWFAHGFCHYLVNVWSWFGHGFAMV